MLAYVLTGREWDRDVIHVPAHLFDYEFSSVPLIEVLTLGHVRLSPPPLVAR